MLLNVLNDVTTSYDNPPILKNGKDYDLKAKALQSKIHPEIRPLQITQDCADIFENVIEAAKSMPRWEEINVDILNQRISAVAVTKWVKFRDDLTIELRENNGSCEIHMRSRSRLGRNDFGANAKRIRDFFEVLNRAM